MYFMVKSLSKPSLKFAVVTNYLTSLIAGFNNIFFHGEKTQKYFTSCFGIKRVLRFLRIIRVYCTNFHNKINILYSYMYKKDDFINDYNKLVYLCL